MGRAKIQVSLTDTEHTYICAGLLMLHRNILRHKWPDSKIKKLRKKIEAYEQEQRLAKDGK